MKILIDARLYGLENAGLGRYAINLVNELAKTDSKNKYYILLRKKYFDSLKFPKNWVKVEAEFRHYSFLEQFKLNKLIKKIKPDFIHSLHYNAPILTNVPFIVTIHDLLLLKHQGVEATTLNPFKYYLKYYGAKYVLQKAVEKSIHIIVPSKAVKKNIIKTYGVDEDKITVTYEGVDAKISSKAGPKKTLRKYKLKKPFFLYVGNAYPHKNLERLIEAVVTLNQNRQEKVTMAIVSSRDVFVKRLSGKIKEKNAVDVVRLLGFVPDAELGDMYKAAEAYIFPSVFEGFGLPGLEAMSLGNISVVSDIPVFKEIYEDAAMYFNPFDYTSIVGAMNNVLSLTNAQRNILIEKGKKQVKKYSWVKMAEETLAIYNRFR